MSDPNETDPQAAEPKTKSDRKTLIVLLVLAAGLAVLVSLNMN